MARTQAVHEGTMCRWRTRVRGLSGDGRRQSLLLSRAPYALVIASMLQMRQCCLKFRFCTSCVDWSAVHTIIKQWVPIRQLSCCVDFWWVQVHALSGATLVLVVMNCDETTVLSCVKQPRAWNLRRSLAAGSCSSLQLSMCLAGSSCNTHCCLA